MGYGEWTKSISKEKKRIKIESGQESMSFWIYVYTFYDSQLV